MERQVKAGVAEVWHGWNNINIGVKVDFHQLDRASVDGTNG